MSTLTVALGCDHAATDVKNKIKQITKWGDVTVMWEDVGTHSEDRVDYPDFAQKVVAKVLSDSASKGVLICGSGIGMSIAANRNKGIRASMIYSDEVAKLTRQHNDANIACFGARTQNWDDIKKWLTLFLNTSFEGGRHLDRIQKLG
jgi:ribose 5-phosphate isomerase B